MTQLMHQPVSSFIASLRSAIAADMPRILELRRMQERPSVGQVPIPTAWLVYEEDGEIHACGGGEFAITEDGRTAIVTDLLDDGTMAGKRGLVALVDDVMQADMDVYIIVPKDRPGLLRALEKRGLELDGFQLRKRRQT